MLLPSVGNQGCQYNLSFILGSYTSRPHLVLQRRTKIKTLGNSRRTAVIRNARLDWKSTEECIKNTSLYQSVLLGRASWKVRLVDTDKIVSQLQENAFSLYGVILAVVGFRLAVAFGMGWSLIGTCILTSCLGYSVFIQQTLIQQFRNRDCSDGPSMIEILLQAQTLALNTMSFKVEQKSKGIGSPMILLSSLFEPSPFYLMLNCWAIYAIGQCAICGAFGDGMVRQIVNTGFLSLAQEVT